MQKIYGNVNKLGDVGGSPRKRFLFFLTMSFASLKSI
jgi:hypothetical protein